MLSIVIINFNSAGLLLDLLQSIREQTTTITYEVIVVDNSADEGGRSHVLAAFPQVQWLSMDYNAGFARANNKGIQVAKGDTVLLLNPDTLIIEKALDQVYPLFKSSDHVACGVQLLNEDGTPQIAGNFAMKGGLNYLLPLPYIGSFLKWLGGSLRVDKPSIEEVAGTREVDWINGAFLMAKQSAIRDAGLLDEDFFLYAEEAEWCSRLKKQGSLVIYGDYHIYHLQGETANAAFQSEGKGYYNLFDKKGCQLIISNFLRIRKQFGVGWFLFDTLMYTIGIPVYAIGKLLENMVHLRAPFSGFKKVAGFTANVWTLWKYAPKIIRNQPHFYKI